MATAVASCFAGGVALANPTGPAVVSGTASFHQQGNLLQITNSPNAIVNWQGFSIGASEITRFLQQSASSAVLNRVISQNPSAILGALQSNGRVFLLNPNGILFGAGAQIDVAGLVASTLNLSDADFLAGRLKFTEVPGAGSVINQGAINAATGGQVYLVGSSVTNSGIITSPKGEVVLAAGNSVELVNPGTPNLRVEITAPDNQAVNLGQIVADAGRIGIYAGLINHSGTIRANSAVVTESGQILLEATKGVTLDGNSVTSVSGPRGGTISVQTETGTIRVAGQLDATGSETAGGAINLAVTGPIGGIDLAAGLYAGNAAVNFSGPGSTMTLNGDTITAGAPITFMDSVVLGDPAAITLDTTNGGAVLAGANITITGTVNDDATASGLVLIAGTAGNNTLGGAVGNNFPIAGLTTSGKTTAINGGLVSTTGSQSYPDAVVLGANTTFSGTNITFSSTVNSDATARALTVNTVGTGVTTFGGRVGGISALRSLTTNADGTTIINADAITAAGQPISFNDSVVLGTPGTITLDTTNGGADAGASIVIVGTVNDDATSSSLVLRAGTTIGVVSLMGAVGGTTPIQGLTVESANAVRLPSVKTREGGVSVAALGPFIRLGGDIDTTQGATDAGNVSLTGPVRLGTNVQITTDHATGADGSVSFVGAASTINPDPFEPGLRSLTILAGSGDVIFGGAVGGMEALQGLTVASANDVSLGAVTTREGGLSVVTADVVADPASIMLSGNLSTTSGVNAGNVSLTGPVTLAADVQITTDRPMGTDGNVSFVGTGSTVNADLEANLRTLTITAGGGNVTFGGAVGSTQALGSLTATGNAVAVNGGAVTTTGPQSYTGAVTLGAPTAFSATGAAGSIVFNTSLSAGANDVTLSAREIDLPAVANTVSDMGTITLQPEADATPIVVGGIADSGAASLDLTDADIAALANGFSLITIGRASGTHAITVNSSDFKDAVTIRAPGVGGSITLDGTLTTTAASDAGAVTLSGPGSTTTLNAGIITAGGAITINDSVVLGTPAAISLDTTNGGPVAAGANVTITGAVDDTGAASGLTVAAGTGGAVQLQVAVGGTTPIANLAVTGNTIDLKAVTTAGPGAGDITLESVGAFTANAPITAGGTGTISVNAAGVTNNATITSAGGLTINAGGGTITNSASAVIAGSGTLTGSSFSNDGTLRPGGSGAVGTLTVVGNATFGSTGVIEIEAQGAGQHDVVAVTGTASLGGQLNVSNIGSYVPANGDSYVPATFASRTGTFIVNPADTYTETYNPMNLTLVFGTVDLINRWIGTSGNWATASNWSFGHVPTGTETVLIDVPGLETVTVSGGERAAHMLTSNENFTIKGGSLDLGGASTFNATLTLSGGKLRGAGDVVVNGDFNWKGGKLVGPGTFTTTGTSTLAPRHGSLQLKRDWINLGTVQWVARHGRDLFIREGATFLNAAGGTLNLKAGNGSDIRGEGELINEGTINKNGSKKISIRAEFSNAGTLNVNRGTLRLKSSAGNNGVINIGRHATLDLHGHRYTNRGLIAGTGTLHVHGVRFTNDGVVAPGGAGGAGIGTLTIDGNYHQGANGVLLMDLGGTAAGQHDVLTITGKAFLGGTLSVNAAGSYVPSAGDSFRLITYHSRSGAFATTVAPAGFDLGSAYQKKFARFTLVPE